MVFGFIPKFLERLICGSVSKISKTFAAAPHAFPNISKYVAPVPKFHVAVKVQKKSLNKSNKR
jgi:hypothetical protein